MGITADKNNGKEIARFISSVRDSANKAVLHFLTAVGEYCVGYARDSGLYTDRSGNLRSSVGYIIFKGKEEVSYSGFDSNANNAEPNKRDGLTGANQGLEYARSLVSEVSADYSLIFVAGMFYAEYVEKKGYDVLIATEIEAETYAQNLWNQISLQHEEANNNN